MEINGENVHKKPVCLIAAVCNDMGIGKDGKLPWDLPLPGENANRPPARPSPPGQEGTMYSETSKDVLNIPCEFQNFINHITRVSRPGNMNMLVWGTVSWYSLPTNNFPLANTLHAVLSTTLDTVPDHAHFLCQDFDSATHLAAQPPLADLIETIWVLGGRQVYKDALEHPWCDLVYLTEVMADFDCDVFFPEFDRGLFKEQEGYPHVLNGIQEENGIKYKFQVLKKMIGDAV